MNMQEDLILEKNNCTCLQTSHHSSLSTSALFPASLTRVRKLTGNINIYYYLSNIGIRICEQLIISSNRKLTYYYYSKYTNIHVSLSSERGLPLLHYLEFVLVYGDFLECSNGLSLIIPSSNKQSYSLKNTEII